MTRTLTLTLLVFVGCSTDGRWQNIDNLKGWTVTEESGLVESAHRRRHPRHCLYIPVFEVKPLSEAEAEAYGELNERMHEELRRVSKEHFANTPVPAQLQKDRDPYFTHFTYHNYDWYVPTYECYIVVIGDYLSAELMQKCQSLLVGDYHDWCIQVVVSESNEFEHDHEIAVFSDQIIVSTQAADFLGVPPL